MNFLRSLTIPARLISGIIVGYFIFELLLFMTPFSINIFGFTSMILYFFLVNTILLIALLCFAIRNIVHKKYYLLHTISYSIFGLVLTTALYHLLNDYLYGDVDKNIFYYYFNFIGTLILCKFIFIFILTWHRYTGRTAEETIKHILETVTLLAVFATYFVDNNIYSGNTEIVLAVLDIIVSYYLLIYFYLGFKNNIMTDTIDSRWFTVPFGVILVVSFMNILLFALPLSHYFYLLGFFVLCCLYTLILILVMLYVKFFYIDSVRVINDITRRAYLSLKDTCSSFLDMAVLVFLINIMHFTVAESIIFALGVVSIVIRHIVVSVENNNNEYAVFDNVTFLREDSKRKMNFLGIGRTSTIFSSSSTAVSIFDEDRNRLAHNRRMLEIFDNDKIDELLPLFMDRDIKMIEEKRNLAYQGLRQDFSARIQKSDSEQKVYEFSLVPIFVDNEVKGIEFMVTDYYTKYALQTSLQGLAYIGETIHETNQNIVIDQIQKDIKQGNLNGALISIELANLDDWINYLPNETIKKLKLQFLENLETSVPKETIILHEGEGIYLLYIKSDKQAVLDLCQKLYHNTTWIKDVDGYNVENGIFQAISFHQEIAGTVEQWIHTTKMLRGIAKDSIAPYLVYEGELKEIVKMKFFIQSNLKKSIANNEFFMVYQPKVDSITNKIKSLEALVRWVSPELGFISPGDFIPIAEESNDIAFLGTYIFKEVVRQQIEWKSQGLPVVPIAINVGTKQFRNKEFLDLILNLYNEYPLDVGDIAIELTERDNIAENNELKNLLYQLREVGYDIQVDDFGAGKTVISSLVELPVTTVKIDRSIVSKVLNEGYRKIIDSIKQIADQLDMAVVCEGVETKEEMEALQILGCNLIQGYYYYRPLPSSEIRALLENNNG